LHALSIEYMTDTTTQPTATQPRADRAPRQGDNRQERGRRTGARTRRPREERPRSEFETKMIDIRRVTRVVAGGRRFSFSVTVVAGDGKGRVGVGLGKASDTALAIEKASKNAQRNLIRVPLTKDGGIPHDVQSRYASADVLLIPAPGKGLKAGSAVRTVLELAGVRNVSGKILTRSKNKLNNARAAVLALSHLSGAAPAVMKIEEQSSNERKDRGRNTKRDTARGTHRTTSATKDTA
jgi:small subunit ribosomal protein S5